MPIYQYACDQCGHAEDEFQHIHDAPFDVCPHCESDQYHRVPCLPNTPHMEFDRPVEMHSLALCHHDDIADFKRRHPDVQCSDNPRDPLYGVPVATSRHEKLRVLQKEGWVEKN